MDPRTVIVKIAHTTHVEDHNTWRHHLESLFKKEHIDELPMGT
jgi:hypothetical protein